MIPSVKTIDASGLVSNIDDARFVRLILASYERMPIGSFEGFLCHHDDSDLKGIAKRIDRMCAWRSKRMMCLHALDIFLGGFGIEVIRRESDDIFDPSIITYVNMGDAYTATICYRHDINMFLVSDYGTQVEILERKGIKTC
jgi:hypothetical protein